MIPLATQFATVFEVWTVNRDGSALRHAGGSYGPLDNFRLLSEETRFTLGDGLPGMVLASRAPVILDRLRVANFARTESGRAAGLTAGIGLPLVVRNQVQSVLTILTGHRSTQFVCEVWRPDHSEPVLRLRDGFYGRYRGFQSISAMTSFPFGQGLPGIVWETRMPQIIENLGASPQFWRAPDARRDGLYTGIGLPVMTGRGMQVVLLLSSRDAPLLKACEIWTPSDDRSTLELTQSAYGDAHDLRPGWADIPLASADGIAGRVWASQRPLVVDNLELIEPLRANKAADAGVTTAIGYPIMGDDGLNAVVVMFC